MRDRPDAASRGAGPSTGPRDSSSWVLVAESGAELRSYPLQVGAELVLGRDLDCEIVLAHHRVSRRHARLRVAADAVAVEDLGSRNGTRVGDRAGAPLPPHQARSLGPGASIAIGPFTLLLVREADARAGDAAAAIAASRAGAADATDPADAGDAGLGLEGETVLDPRDPPDPPPEG